MVTLAFAGDVMLGREVNETLRDEPDPRAPWTDVLPLLLEADVRIINLECAVTTHLDRWKPTPKVFYFRADPSALRVLTAARIDACSLANNHTLDFEEVGLLDTLRHLDEAGIRCAGAGRTLDEARRPAMLDAGGQRIGLVAFTDNEPAFAAGPDHPGTFYLPVSVKPEVVEPLARSIAEARRAGADLVVVSSHWGPNMVTRPRPLFRRFAREVMDLGADVFFGHSAHVFQGVELYRGKPILYDTGDFLDDYAVDPVLRNDWSFLFRLTFEGARFMGLELVPMELSMAKVRQAKGFAREVMLERMTMLSEELGTHLKRHGDRLYLEPHPVRPERSEGEPPSP
ncbi:MAG: CapA family protein [Myxococcota bacterium]